MVIFYRLDGSYYKTVIDEAVISFRNEESFYSFKNVIILESESRRLTNNLQRLSIIRNFSEQLISETEVDEDVKEALRIYGSKSCVFINKALKIKEAHISKYDIYAFEKLEFVSTERIKFRFSNQYKKEYDYIHPSKNLNRLLKTIKDKQLNNILFEFTFEDSNEDFVTIYEKVVSHSSQTSFLINGNTFDEVRKKLSYSDIQKLKDIFMDSSTPQSLTVDFSNKEWEDLGDYRVIIKNRNIAKAEPIFDKLFACNGWDDYANMREEFPCYFNVLTSPYYESFI